MSSHHFCDQIEIEIEFFVDMSEKLLSQLQVQTIGQKASDDEGEFLPINWNSNVLSLNFWKNEIQTISQVRPVNFIGPQSRIIVISYILFEFVKPLINFFSNISITCFKLGSLAVLTFSAKVSKLFIQA